MNRSFVLVTVSGPDKPGITSTLMKTLVKNQTKLLDMGQSVTHGLLSLTFVLDLEKDESHPALKDLLFEAKSIGMNLDFEIIQDRESPHRIHEKYILSCVAPLGVTASFMADTAETLARHKINIQRIDNTSTRGFQAMDIAAQTR
jgi:phosphoserine phosphatase